MSSSGRWRGPSWRRSASPHTAEWLEAGVVSREAWRKAGELGDVRCSVVMAEEIAATGTQGIALALHTTTWWRPISPT